jgi:hypothetical protein
MTTKFDMRAGAVIHRHEQDCKFVRMGFLSIPHAEFRAVPKHWLGLASSVGIGQLSSKGCSCPVSKHSVQARLRLSTCFSPVGVDDEGWSLIRGAWLPLTVMFLQPHC